MSPEWHFLITLNEHLRPLKDPVAIQEVAVRLIGEHLHASRVKFAHSDGDDFVVNRSYADGVPPFAGRGSVGRFGRPIVDAWRRGETVAVDNVETDPRFTDAERKQLLAGDAAAFVGTPLIKDGRWVATFSVDSAAPRTWTRDQIALVEIAADRTWSASERARAEEALGRSETRQAFLRRLNDTIRPLADRARILQEACRLLGTHLRVNRVAFGEVEGDACIIVHDYVDGVPSLVGRLQWRNLGGSRAADILKGWTMSVSDTATESHTAEERAALQAMDIGAYICPLLIKDDRFVGAFGIHSRSPRVWTPDEIALVQDVADRVWATLEHRKAEAELRAKEERLAFLLRLNDAVRPLSDAAAIQETTARYLCEHFSAARVSYAELQGGEYIIRREHARGAEPLVGMPLIGVRGGLGEDFRRGATIAVSDVQTDQRLSDAQREAFRSRQMAAVIGVGHFKDGEMVAAFGAGHDTPRVWTATEMELIREAAERTWDAVERTRAEAALREQKTRLGLALEASGGGSWTWDLRTNDADWDRVFRARFGFTPEEAASFDTWLARVHADDRPLMLRTLDEVLQGRDAWDHTYRFVRPDGTVLWMQSLGRAERDASGHAARLTGLELDITERRRTEEALQARREEAYDRTLRTLLETATQGIVSVDGRGRLVSANRAVEVMFGWTAEELIGQPIERLIPSLVKDDGSTPSGGVNLVGRREDGSTFPIEVTVNHVPTPGGGRAFAFVTDITERQRAAAALQERTAELEYRTTQLRQMAWDLTLAEHHAREQMARTLHDGLQQLLVVVAVNLEQHLKRESDTGAAPSELLAEAMRQLDEAMTVARSLNVELFPPVLQRSGLPAALAWLAEWAHEKYKLSVEITADPRADSARKDVRTLLFESVRELLFNAVKYANTDHVTLTLELDADDQLRITVADQGVGFDTVRLDDRSKSGHVGWGLFRIGDRLTLLGGRLIIDSAPGKGTRICLLAPRGAAQGTAAAANELSLATPRAASPINDDRASADALRILIVDDHSAVRDALRKMLHQRPQLSVVGDASNGLEAIAQASTLRPDVILMDVSMPHMDGIEATARIHAQFRDIRILGLSMLTRSEIAHAIEKAGASGFFAKGTDTHRLIDHLLDFHAGRGARRAGS
jgi:PAS domain S-box-containing protein